MLEMAPSTITSCTDSHPHSALPCVLLSVATGNILPVCSKAAAHMFPHFA